MRWHIFAIGKPKLEFARFGVEEYLPRLRPFTTATIEFIKPSSPPIEAVHLLERSKAMCRIVLDEQGEQIDSRALAKKLAGFEMRGGRDFALLIGGADGLSAEVRESASWIWSLSKLTLQHEMALVLSLEQLYRAYTIKAGMPYHRD